MQHALISCRNYDHQSQDLLRELQEIGLEEVSLKSILVVELSRSFSYKIKIRFDDKIMKDFPARDLMFIRATFRETKGAFLWQFVADEE